LDAVELVDASAQRKEIEALSSKTLFLGPSDEVVPEELKLEEWEAMEYVEPVFICP
jgi:hypothetical protein